jgi:uncharacterized protein (DUF302 family)
MAYYFNRLLRLKFEDAIQKVIAALKQEGFGVLSDIDVKATLKQKINVDFRAYRILGACNPSLAHQALAAEDKIGTMLPCNVIVQDLGGGNIEVAAINPLVAMERVANPELTMIAQDVAARLERVIAVL